MVELDLFWRKDKHPILLSSTLILAGSLAIGFPESGLQLEILLLEKPPVPSLIGNVLSSSLGSGGSVGNVLVNRRLLIQVERTRARRIGSVVLLSRLIPTWPLLALVQLRYDAAQGVGVCSLVLGSCRMDEFADSDFHPNVLSSW